MSKLVSTTGEPLKTREERLGRWTEHFKHLLNPATTSGNSLLSIVEASESLEIDLCLIRFAEVLYAVRKLKNGKASGPDDISAKMLKLHNGIAEWLWDIVNKCWPEENLPQDWKLAEVVPLCKNKGKISECGNYSGISLLSVPGKVFASIILNRCKDALDQVLRESQCGFRKSRGCTDQLFALRQILEKCMAFQLYVSFCFADFRAAFGLVDRKMMYKIMKHYGLPQKVVNVIRNSYEGFNVYVPCRGPFGVGEENDNSEKLLSFCVSHGLLIGGTWFQHRLVHRYTFNPPDQQMRKKMLDHILFGSRHRSCLLNVRTRRGKTTLTGHEIVIAEVRFKLMALKPRSQPKVCSANLRDDVTHEAF